MRSAAHRGCWWCGRAYRRNDSADAVALHQALDPPAAHAAALVMQVGMNVRAAVASAAVVIKEADFERVAQRPEEYTLSTTSNAGITN
jgi:hypothetical protein